MPATVVVVYDKNVNRKRRNFTPVVMEEKHRGSLGALCIFAPCETRRASDSALKVEQQPCSFVQQRRTNKRRIVETGVSEIRCSNRKTRRVYTLYIYIYIVSGERIEFQTGPLDEYRNRYIEFAYRKNEIIFADERTFGPIRRDLVSPARSPDNS